MSERGRSVEGTNLDKVFFPAVGVTKGDVLSYYARIADHLLATVGGRPLVLQRFPDGIDSHGFYQKDAPDYFPEWINTVGLETEQGTVTRYPIADAPDTITYLANQGTVTFHTLLADAGEPRRPVEVIFDLDPSGEDLAPVRLAARLLREALQARGRHPQVKSSGSRGLHVHVETQGEEDFDQSRGFARDVAGQVIDEAPDRLTMEHRKARRGDRLFVDVLRNAPAAHAVAPYSLRPKEEAPVAVPLDWDEALSARFDPRRVTIANVFRRLAQRSDPWSGRRLDAGGS